MSKPTTGLLEEMLKGIDEQQLQKAAEARTARSRKTLQIVKPRITEEIPSLATNFIPEGSQERAKPAAEAGPDDTTLPL